MNNGFKGFVVKRGFVVESLFRMFYCVSVFIVGDKVLIPNYIVGIIEEVIFLTKNEIVKEIEDIIKNLEEAIPFCFD